MLQCTTLSNRLSTVHKKCKNKILIKEMFFNRISNWTGYSKINDFHTVKYLTYYKSGYSTSLIFLQYYITLEPIDTNAY